MTKEILDKLTSVIEHEVTKMSDGFSGRYTAMELAAKAALEVFKEYVVFLEEGAEPQEGDNGVINQHRVMYTEHKGEVAWWSLTGSGGKLVEDYSVPIDKRNGKPVVMLPKVGE